MVSPNSKQCTRMEDKDRLSPSILGRTTLYLDMLTFFMLLLFFFLSLKYQSIFQIMCRRHVNLDMIEWSTNIVYIELVRLAD